MRLTCTGWKSWSTRAQTRWERSVRFFHEACAMKASRVGYNKSTGKVGDQSNALPASVGVPGVSPIVPQRVSTRSRTMKKKKIEHPLSSFSLQHSQPYQSHRIAFHGVVSTFPPTAALGLSKSDASDRGLFLAPNTVEAIQIQPRQHNRLSGQSASSSPRAFGFGTSSRFVHFVSALLPWPLALSFCQSRARHLQVFRYA